MVNPASLSEEGPSAVKTPLRGGGSRRGRPEKRSRLLRRSRRGGPRRWLRARRRGRLSRVMRTAFDDPGAQEVASGDVVRRGDVVAAKRNAGVSTQECDVVGGKTIAPVISSPRSKMK